VVEWMGAGRMSRTRWAWISAVAIVGMGALPRDARADEVIDTVLLSNGGRLRGVVMVDDPKEGVSIKLIDGTTRAVKRAEIKEVDYGGVAATAPSTQASASALPPLAASTRTPPPSANQAGVLPAIDDTPHPAAKHSGPNAGMIVGAILLSVGATAAAVGGAIVATDNDATVPGAVVAVGGGVFVVAGVIALCVGAATRSSSPSVSLNPAPITVSPGVNGLALHF
jgi:hypothetical protein